MEERQGETLAGTEQLTVMGRQLHVSDDAPDFCLDYPDLADMVVRTISLADSTGMVRLLSVVNSLERPLCQHVTRRWEAHPREPLPHDKKDFMRYAIDKYRARVGDIPLPHEIRRSVTT